MAIDYRSPHFSVALERDGDARVVAVRGELDLATREPFAEALAAAEGDGGGAIVIDLSGVDFMDSSGLHSLLRLRRRLALRRCELAIVCSRTGLHRLFALTGLDAAFALYDTRPEALAAVQPRAVPSPS